MILLGSRLGLRSADIRNLKFQNIDWDNNKIRIVQIKTGNQLELPLLSAVGEAIIDYVKNGRPPSRYTRIFVGHNYPYETISTDVFYRTVRKYVNMAGVMDNNRVHGTHTFRHSLATALMNNGEQLPTISGILGHSSSESTKYYLGVDFNSLLRCSLDVPPVDDAFYLQKGGVFYD